jgi:hypothetical protein
MVLNNLFPKIMSLLAAVLSVSDQPMLLHSNAPNNIDLLHSTVGKIANIQMLFFP